MYLVATDLLHIEQNGLGSYANVTGAIADRSVPAQGHSADAGVTARMTLVNQGSEATSGTARALLLDLDGTQGEIRKVG